MIARREEIDRINEQLGRCSVCGHWRANHGMPHNGMIPCSDCITTARETWGLDPDTDFLMVSLHEVEDDA